MASSQSPPPITTANPRSSTEIINLNVGGTKFSTSRQTLTQIPDTFFTGLLSGRIMTFKDDTGAIFIDRDPQQFRVILNYLRNRSLSLEEPAVNLKELKHEAEFYGLAPLVRKLALCEELDKSGCGDVLFYSYLAPPSVPPHEPPPPSRLASHSRGGSADLRRSHSRTSSSDLRQPGGPQRPVLPPPPIPGPTSTSTTASASHSRNSSADLVGFLAGWTDPLRVLMVAAHHNCLAVAYKHFVAVYRLRESSGFQISFTTPHLEKEVSLVAINSKIGSVLPGAGLDQVCIMLAVASGNNIRLMGYSEEGAKTEIGLFSLQVTVDQLFFIGAQLVALSPTGRIGVWNSLAQHWQVQELSPITAHDTAGSFLLLGSSNGSINYIDMQKFPLRMKDNDLLVTELYRDPAGDSVTAISVYLTPKTSLCGNWIEIAYGTASGMVRVIVQHPETVGHGPQLFQTFTAHR